MEQHGHDSQSPSSQQLHNTQTLFILRIYCFIYETLIFISLRTGFSLLQYKHFSSILYGYMHFSPHLLTVESPVSFCTPVVFFLTLSLAAELHIHLCKCNFYEKKCFCMKRNQKFCNDFYQHKMHHEECHPWHRGGTPRQFFQDAFLDTRQSCHTHTHKHTYTHTRECRVHPFSMKQIHTN